MAVAARELGWDPAPRHPSPLAALRLVPPPPRVPRAVYRRRRLAVLAGLVLAAVGVWALVGLLEPTPGYLDAPAVEPVVVGEGDTVWGIADEHRPDDLALRVYVAEVLAYNGLDARALQPGTVLRLP